MRKRARIDDNQGEIISALRKIGASVEPLHEVGGGCPDLLVGFRGRNYLLEVKDGSKSPSRRRLTPEQGKWHAKWSGSVRIVASVAQAISVVQEI